MKKISRRSFLAAAGLAAASAALTACGSSASSAAPASSAAAGSTAALTTWPTKTLEIICPDSTGSGTDLNSRILAPYLEKKLGTTVVVTNKSGGGSTLCSQALMDGKNDGSLMALIHSAFISTKIWGTVDYDYSDATMIANLFSVNTALICANKQSGLTSFKDLVERCKANPGSVSTVCDVGSIVYLEVASMELNLGIEIAKVDAGGVTERIATVVGGHADTVILNISDLKSYIDSGDLVPLAIICDQRSDVYPDVPTVEELYGWSWAASPTAAFFPPETDAALVETMSNALEEILQDPSYIEEYVTANNGNFIDFMDAADATAFWDGMRDDQIAAYNAAGLG